MHDNFEYIFRKSKFAREIGTFEYVYHEVMNNRQYVSPSEEFKICRYCGETSANKFLSKAHFIPEFTGNRSQLNYNECDDCNNKFSLYENNLKNFGMLNILLPIKGKKKFPLHQDNENKTATKFTDPKTIETKISSEDAFYLGNDIVKVKRSSTSFTPIYVQKALTKLAISMLPKEELESFKPLINWLLNKSAFTDDNVEMMAFYTADLKTTNLTPTVHLYKRNNDYNCPQYSLLFFWGHYKIQIFVTCNPHDIHLENLSKINLPISKLLASKHTSKVFLNYFDFNTYNKYIVSTETSHHFKNNEDYKVLHEKINKFNN